MAKSEIVERIRDVGVIPVVRASSAAEAVQVVEAITAGGVSLLEITMTVPGAVQVIEQLVKRFGDQIVVGAGTVLDPEVARACIAVGAQFIVSPALNLETINCCRDQAIPVMPGALTPTEIVTAWNAGADFVKVFPCGAVGGVRVGGRCSDMAYDKAVSAKLESFRRSVGWAKAHLRAVPTRVFAGKTI